MIPKEKELKLALLKELYYSKDYSLKTDNAYSMLFEYFDITEEEMNVQYQNSPGKFQTDVRYAVRHLKDEGYILHHSNSDFGIWKLSTKGIVEGKRLYIETYGYDPHESLDEIKLDIKQIEKENDYTEGEKEERLSSYYERNPEVRRESINLHGLKCMVCKFDFEDTYGELGKGFIEVHHVVPISSFNGEHNVNPKTDMTVLCANCHRMMHRKKNTVLSVEDLKAIIEKNKNNKP